MKFRTVFCSSLVAGASALTVQAEASAQSWLLDHPNSNSDDLAELKTENPDAYALVKALLTKRSLGLLDPKHPTASFASPPPKDSSDQPSGAAVYAKFATTEREQQALQGANPSEPYPEAEGQSVMPYPEANGAPHDWINWKPHDSASDDEAMVKNVLGAVADLTKGKSLRGSVASDDGENSLAAETASIAAEDTTTVVVQATTTLSVIAPQETAHENSYLKGLDLVAASVAKPRSVKVEAESENNALTAFNWDDSATSTTTISMQKVPKAAANPLASWLGLAKPHVQAAPAPAQKPSNPYLMDLQ